MMIENTLQTQSTLIGRIAYKVIQEYIGGDWMPYVLFGKIVSENETHCTIQWDYHSTLVTVAEKRHVQIVPNL
jgi:hypothetical protein